MKIDKFEDKRWSSLDQEITFRHIAALDLIEPGRIIDLGCGTGILLDLLKEKRIDAEGADISKAAVEKSIRKGHKTTLLNGEEEKLPFDDGQFDCVVLLDVLEHLYDPESFLTEAGRISRKDVIIGVPNFNSLPARIQVMFGKTPENNKPKKGHIYWFNLDVLTGVVEKSRLRMTDLRVNTFWQDKPIIGRLMIFLAGLFPNIFALSFVIKAQKIKDEFYEN